ncbi:SPOR domain-containing protein [Rhizobium sp. RAF56]|uniref:SPOR domain-containing protein n=1 Tax=Rhizobium sp. RAF56 TaxID=3233062 RepID=UPI003F971255
MQAKSKIVPSQVSPISSSHPGKFIAKVFVGFALAFAAVSTSAPAASAAGPSYAGIVIDAKTGAVLYSEDADSLHYPASLTKMMTLYLAFEALESGRIQPDTAIVFSRNASAQAPSKLGVRAGGSITVEQAILAVVTRSANDAAMALGENLGGSEDGFARMMNNKARALGMTRTTYRNPNGLPNTAQMTTARDQARLGIALREHFPQYYGYFSTRSFRFGNQVIGNHNHLLGSVRGVDGIKTGYTRAAGFNLVSSVQADGRSIVGVVLGGTSTPARDNQMRKLIASYLPKASTGADKNLIAQTAPTVPPAQAPAQPNVAAAAARMADVADTEITKSVTREAPPSSSAAAFAAVTPQPAATAPLKARTTKTAQAEVASIAPAYAEGDEDEVDTVTTGTTPKVAKAEAKQEKTEKTPSGWVVQVGISPSKEMASDLLDAAKAKGGKALRSAKSYTVAFGSGSSQVYRARFGGFEDQRDATNACKALKKAGVKCWASME